MSRAFTSEEYEAPEVVIEVPEKREPSADMELVFAYSKDRSLSDPSLPYEIGMHFLEGSGGFFQSDEFAVKWLDNAVKEGSVDAMMALADFYLKDTKTHGYRKPASLLKMAADRGNEDARARLDMDHIDDPTSRKTFNAYRFNAELGDVMAMNLLAEGFEKGHFGKNKEKAAAFWYTKAFKKGDKDAAKRVLALYYKKRIELTEEELRFLRS
ncbi:MAG: sel1 repeat family protein [Thermoplasmata archaeon]|nr:sel1 repeat family protein [Thermoplasmata archaeon]